MLRTSLARFSAILIAASLSLHQSAHATAYTWTGSGNTWTGTGDWSPTGYPTATDSANFSGLTANQTVNLNGNQATGTLAIAGSETGATLIEGGTAASTFSLGNGGITLGAGSGALTIGGTGVNAVTVAVTTAQSWVNSSSNVLTVQNGVTLTGSLTLSGSGAGTTFNGALSGAGGLTNTGAVTITLAGANTYSGSTGVAAGTLNLTGSLSGTSITTSGLGVLTESATGVIAGGGSLTQNSSGTSTLAGANTFTGATSVSNGVLDLSNPLALQGSAVTVSGTGALVFDQAVTGNAFTIGGLAGALNQSLTNNATTPAPILLTIGTNLNDATSNSTTYTYTGTLSGTGASIRKGGLAIENLNGVSTYTGTTTVQNGTLEFGNEKALYNDTPTSWTASNIVVENGATLAFGVGGATNPFTATDLATLLALGTSTGGFENGSNVGFDTTGGNFTYGSPITNTNGGANAIGLEKIGTNTLTLTAANTFTGSTNIIAGGLTLGVGGTLGNGSYAANIINTGTLTYANTSASQLLSGVISGSGALTLSATGQTLTLSNANTFTGATTLTAGTLDVDNSLALQGSVLTLSGGAVTFDAAVTSNAFTLGGLSGATNLALQNNATTPAPIALTVGSILNGGTGTYTGVLSGGGSLTKGGTGTLVLEGASTYTGTTSVNGGTLNLGGSTANGSVSSTGVLSLGGGTLSLTRSGSATQSFASTTVAQGSSAVTAVAGDTINLGVITNAFNSGVDFGATGTINTTTMTNNNGIIGGWATEGGGSTWAVAPATAGGAITGLASYSVYNTAATTFAPGATANVDIQASNTTAATTQTINSLRFNQATGYTLTIAPTSTVTIATGGVLATSATGTSTITGGTIVAGSGNVLYFDTAKTLVIGSAIADNGDGSATSLVINGVGGVNLPGVASSFTGGVYVNAGTIDLGTNALSAGTGTIFLGAPGDGTTAGILEANSLNYANPIVVNPGGYREIYTSSGGSPTFSGPVTLVGGATLAAGINNNNSLTMTGGVTGTGNYEISNVLNGRAGNDFVSGGAINITGTFTDVVNLPVTGALTGTVLVSAPVIGNTQIVQGGVPTLFAFTGTNTNVGATTIQSGTLSLGNGGATGLLSPNSAITDNGTLAFNETANLVQGTAFANGIVGTGGITKLSTGTTTFSGTNTFSGPILVSAGAVEFANEASLYGGNSGQYASSITVANGATFEIGVGASPYFSAADLTALLGIPSSSSTGFESGSTIGIDTTNAGGSFTYGGLIANTNAGANVLNVAKYGAGTLVLTFADTYTGTTTVAGGALQLGNGTANGTILNTAGVTLAAGTNLILDDSGNFTQAALVGSGAVTGAGGVTQEGSGTLTLPASNSFTGGFTDVTTTNFSAAAGFGTGTVTLAGATSSGGLLNYTGGNGSLANSLTVTTGDYGTINNQGTGLLTLGGPISKNGSVLTLEGFNGGNFNVTGVISGANAGSDLDVLGSTVVTLSAVNTYNGPTNINGSPMSNGMYDVLVAGVSGALPSGSVVSLGNTDGGGYENILDLNGTSQTIAGLSSGNDTNGDANYVVNSTGTASGATYNVNNAATGSLTINPTGSSNYGGTLGNGTGGNNFSVTIGGTGTQTFSGANSYTGGTTVNGNLYLANGTNGSATGNGPLVVSGGGTLGGIGSSSGPSFSIAGSSGNRATVLVGQTSPLDTNTTGQMYLSASTGSISNANLVFNITANGNGAGNELNVAATPITFGAQLQSTVLTLDLQGPGFISMASPYVLIAGTGTTGNLGTGGLTTGQFAGLTTVMNAQGLDQIVGSNSGGSGNLLLAFGGLNGAIAQSYYGAGSYLYINDSNGVDDIDVEVVPEPSTWCMLIGGFATLLVWQRRRRA